LSQRKGRYITNYSKLAAVRHCQKGQAAELSRLFAGTVWFRTNLDGEGIVQPVTVVRKRKVQVNVERAVKAIFGYAASLSAFLGGYQSDQADKETDPWMDIPMVLTWFRERMGRYVLALSIKDYHSLEKVVLTDDHGTPHIVVTEMEKRRQDQALRELFREKVTAKRLECGLQTMKPVA